MPYSAPSSTYSRRSVRQYMSVFLAVNFRCDRLLAEEGRLGWPKRRLDPALVGRFWMKSKGRVPSICFTWVPRRTAGLGQTGLGQNSARSRSTARATAKGRLEPLARGRGRSLVSTDREWLHRVESGLSGGPARSAGSTSVEGCRCSRLPPLGQWVPVSVLGSRIAQSLFGSRLVSRSGRVGSDYPITDRAKQLRYEPLPHFTITATSAWPFIALAHAPNVIRPCPSAGRRPRTRSVNSAIASASIRSSAGRRPAVAVLTFQKLSKLSKLRRTVIARVSIPSSPASVHRAVQRLHAGSVDAGTNHPCHFPDAFGWVGHEVDHPSPGAKRSFGYKLIFATRGVGPPVA
jgi:hypothetical protein